MTNGIGHDDSWRSSLTALTALCLVVLGVFHADALQLIRLWWTNSTFTHCLLLVPVIGWLIWLRRAELVKLQPRRWWPGLLWMAGGSLIWLVGDVTTVAMVRQIGLIVMLQATVPTLLGPQVTRGLLFPLAYSIFLIPFGEELVPPMQSLTADIAMVMLRLVGIPAYLDGIFITTPYGYFAIAEACSGVKFLIAMAALAVLAAHLCFSYWARRLMFLAFALAVPVFANGLRAFSTILIAEYWGNDFAAGADHVIYGWIFFALVMGLTGWVAWPWFDRDADDVPISAEHLANYRPGKAASAWGVGMVFMMILSLPFLFDRLSIAQAAGLPSFAVDVPSSGWSAGPMAPSDWQAHFAGADQFACRRYRQAGRTGAVDLCIAGFVRQQEGRELVGYGQGAVEPGSGWRWGQDLDPIGQGRATRIVANGRVRDVMTVYSIGGKLTSSGEQAKWLTLKARLTWGDERAYALVLSAETDAYESGHDRLARFVTDSGGLSALLARLTGEP